MDSQIAQQMVRYGMRVLDRVQPGWDERVMLSQLDTRSARSCILGQVYGSFAAGASRLGAPSTVCGCDLPPAWSTDANHDLLTACWREAIAARRVERLMVAAALPSR